MQPSTDTPSAADGNIISGNSPATFQTSPNSSETYLKSLSAQVVSFPWTRFTDLQATTKETLNQTWPEFIESIKNPRLYKNKKAMPLFKGAQFGDRATKARCLRHDANMGYVSAIEIDYDGGLVSIDQAAELLEAAGIEGCFYSSPRHTPARPRWRLICPLSKPCRPSARAEFVALVNCALGDIVAPESFTPSQAFYIGAVEGVPYASRHVSGRPVDAGPDLFLSAKYKDQKPRTEYESSSIDDIPDLVTDDALRDIGDAVRALKAERSETYPLWVAGLQHLKHLAWCGRPDEAENLARKFSMRSAKFNEGEFDKKWRQLPAWKGHFRTLFVLAEQDGWLNPLKGTGDGLADMTDAGNVNALACITKGDLRYAHERGLWLHWDGNRWQEDPAATQPTQAALKVAAGHKDKAKSMEAKAAEATTTAETKQYQKLADTYKTFSNYCRSRRGIDAMLALATRDPRFVIFQASLDRDIYLLGVQNGVVDLRTGHLRETARDDFITKQSPYTYRPDATAPRFLQFVNEITSRPIDDGDSIGLIQYQPRPELARYLQNALGYMLTGSALEHKMFIASGGGANGKSIMFDLATQIMGDYAGSIPAESLMASARGDDAERPTPFARSVAGKRMIVTSEAKEGQKLNAALVKRQTGDATLTARGMRENAVTFSVTHKIVLLTNHSPELDHADDATKGRLHCIPYDRTWNRPGVPNRNPRLEDGDKHLMEKLKAESEGVLAWLVRGAVTYSRDGLEPPPDVADMTNAYLAEQDSFGRWLSEMETCEVKQGLGASTLFEMFRSWCDINGASLSPSTSTAFGRTASNRNVPKGRGATGVTYGLRPIAQDFF
ncbi:MAG: phage/plasmid primase, P4 family [Polaromonas sp.]